MTATYVPPKINTQLIFPFALVDQSNTLLFKSNPTLAAGDFKVSIDFGALADMATLPTVTPASSKLVKGTLSTSEMNAANTAVIASDASGAEWCDALFGFQTTAQQVDDLFALGAALPAGPIPGLAIVENGVAASVTATTLTSRTMGSTPLADQFRGEALWIRGFGVVTIDGNTAANPTVFTFNTPPAGAPSGTPNYIVGAQANQSTSNPPLVAMQTAAAKILADIFLARNQKGGSDGPSGQQVADALAGGLLDFTMGAGGLSITVKNGDGTTAYTRTITRAALNAINGAS